MHRTDWRLTAPPSFIPLYKSEAEPIITTARTDAGFDILQRAPFAPFFDWPRFRCVYPMLASCHHIVVNASSPSRKYYGRINVALFFPGPLNTLITDEMANIVRAGYPMAEKSCPQKIQKKIQNGNLLKKTAA
jgi:hypothetical protein